MGGSSAAFRQRRRQHMARTRDPEGTRQALLGAATDLFARHGYEGATVEMIARRARVNKAMVSYHFGGKKRLYHAILSETFASASEAVGGIRASQEPAEVRLRHFV